MEKSIPKFINISPPLPKITSGSKYEYDSMDECLAITRTKHDSIE